MKTCEEDWQEALGSFETTHLWQLGFLEQNILNFSFHKFITANKNWEIVVGGIAQW
jgi:hypothetical protein